MRIPEKEGSCMFLKFILVRILLLWRGSGREQFFRRLFYINKETLGSYVIIAQGVHGFFNSQIFCYDKIIKQQIAWRHNHMYRIIQVGSFFLFFCGERLYIRVLNIK